MSEHHTEAELAAHLAAAQVDHSSEVDLQLSFERPDPAKRAPLNKDEHIRQLQIVCQNQAERIKWLTTVKRKLTKEQLTAVVHVLDQTSHSVGSCPMGSGRLCPHRDRLVEARAKLKQAVK